MENWRNLSGMAARNSDEQEETSILANKSKPTEWTDEKHSLYLKSMEATFVNQLYKSLDFIGRKSHKNNQFGSNSKSSKHKDTGIGTPSGQFKVLQDGFWSKIEFQRDDSEVNQEEGSRVILTNPWIRHYRCRESQPIRKFQTLGTKDPSKTTTNQRLTNNFRFWQQDSVNSNTEVTDQNFIDEEEKPERTHEIKRTRTSNNDQVVPFDDIIRVDYATENHVHPED